jgi:hypothetical protein
VISPVRAGLKPALTERVIFGNKVNCGDRGEHHHSEERAEHRAFNMVLTAVSL